MRIAAQPEDFDNYKKIIKELLFNGAKLDLRTDQGNTARDLLDDIDDLDDRDYLQLRSILTYKRPCMCFMTRRPIQKVERSPLTLIFGVCFNLTTVLIYYIGLNEKTHGVPDGVLMESTHTALIYTSICLLLICVPLFVLTVFL